MRQEFLDKIAKIEEIHGPLEEPQRPYNSSIYNIEPEDEDDVMTIKGLHLLADGILRRYNK
jgi:hypothetical protein